MHCPFCGTQDTKVIDSRLVNDGASVRVDGNAPIAKSGLQPLKLRNW